MENSTTSGRPKQNITIYTEANPNPNSMKFMLSFMLLKGGESYDFPSVKEAEVSPLAKEIFEKFDIVDRIFYMSNFITITKKDDTVAWMEVIPQFKAFLLEYFEAEKPIFENVDETIVEAADSEAIKKIKGVLDEYIKPAVEMDGGAIKFHSFDEESGVVKVLLQGACSGCPSSTFTLKMSIENLLKRMVPQVTEVVAEGV
ncbi:NifU family protein [Flammeovirga kamogawensis]|uniref:NifU family protein n=1 Tax=Flammeovirga kamogawensis TaxID=373891 RepID=A0ABX8GSB2_9BACT|nr:NifU family protein [Flammeovirga kamogawensis]MBB6461400.1 Fe-S cluster biogenesis protein NfuA [Flammeovirga kamogawensis]QWG06299.1 NifU family protein [Flammeovirga kamogawensis]TRX68128.1 NifU family protein [Flammeovirga kamogawensis]